MHWVNHFGAIKGLHHFGAIKGLHHFGAIKGFHFFQTAEIIKFDLSIIIKP